MTVQVRLDQRWQTEVGTLDELASRSGGRLRLRSVSSVRVQIEMECISAFLRPGEGQPMVCNTWHRISLSRSTGWPALSVQATHDAPAGIWHPNIALVPGAVESDQPVVAIQQLLGALQPGVICYGQAGPETRLVDIALHIYNMLGYRFGAYARADEHLNALAVVWVNEMLQANAAFFPLERRPLVARPRGGTA